MALFPVWKGSADLKVLRFLSPNPMGDFVTDGENEAVWLIRSYRLF